MQKPFRPSSSERTPHPMSHLSGGGGRGRGGGGGLQVCQLYGRRLLLLPNVQTNETKRRRRYKTLRFLNGTRRNAPLSIPHFPLWSSFSLEEYLGKSLFSLRYLFFLAYNRLNHSEDALHLRGLLRGKFCSFGIILEDRETKLDV